MIYIANKRSKIENIQKRYPSATILDITSDSQKRYALWLSPFYPHYNIPIPFTEGISATCVEAVWQGLKVFKDHDVDLNTFKNDTMKGIKRTVRKYGPPLGHRKGVFGSELLDYDTARKLIYIPTYKWVLDNVPCVHETVLKIKEFSKENDVVFLDYNICQDIDDTSKPLSHANLVKLYIEDNYPLFDY